MKHGPWLLILLLCLLPMRATPATKTFPIRTDQPKITGYAEVVWDAHHGRSQHLGEDARIWFQGRRKYRIESRMHSSRFIVYQIANGEYLYMACLNASKPARARWTALPRSRQSDALDLHLQQRSFSILDSLLVGRERMHGLPVEHWRGTTRTKRGSAKWDIWVSTDQRFPLVLRAEGKSRNISTSWAITKLDLTSPVPDYIFTEQAVPKPGFLRLLLLPHRSPIITVLWHTLMMLAYAGALFPLAWRVNTGRLGIRILVAMASMTVWGFLTVRSPGLEAYLLSFWGLPVIAGIALVNFAFVILSLRVIGRPAGASIFKGTTWAVGFMVPAAILLGMWGPYLLQGNWLRFVHSGFQLAPSALIGSLLLATGLSAVEELLFRGYLFSALQSRLRSVYMVIPVQAAIFALYHVPARLHLNGVSAYFAFDMGWMLVYGIVLGVLRQKYRNLGVPWLVHSAFNAGYYYVFYSGLAGILNAHF